MTSYISGSILPNRQLYTVFKYKYATEGYVISYHASQCQVNVMLVQTHCNHPHEEHQPNIRVGSNDPDGSSVGDQG